MKKALLLLAPILLFSCGGRDKVKLADQSIGDEAYQYFMPGQKGIVHPKYGKEIWFAYGAMSGVGDKPANGVVQGYVYEDGTSALTMSLNILPARDGTFYEVWISGKGTEDVPAGHLSNHFGDARHQLQFVTTDINMSEYTYVTVTLEMDDGNPERSQALVAEGILKLTQR